MTSKSKQKQQCQPTYILVSGFRRHGLDVDETRLWCTREIDFGGESCGAGTLGIRRRGIIMTIIGAVVTIIVVIAIFVSGGIGRGIGSPGDGRRGIGFAVRAGL